MISNFNQIITFSKGMMKNQAINYFWGDKLSFASRRYDTTPCFIGWGNKQNTLKVERAATEKKIPYFRLEDGFIRSVGLGVQGAASFSIVTDDLGIYYDATRPSRLEQILMEHDFLSDTKLEEKAEQAINLIKSFKISKYNATTELPDSDITDNDRKKILVIAQTAGDMSLEYGLGNNFSTSQIIAAALWENPGAEIYLKIHPDVIAGKKKSDLNIKQVPEKCRIITRDINPIALLEKIDKVYTKTSQMGFEALLLGKECVCFGMPFYAGWGLTDDRIKCFRRNRKLTVNQVFAGAYILYCRYYNPYLNQESDIIDTLYTIKKYRDIAATSSVFPVPGFSAAFEQVRKFFEQTVSSSRKIMARIK
jgi:capsular polysaccharide export protein